MRDIDKIPRNHLRLVQWRAFLVRRSKRWPGLREPRQQLEMVELMPGTQYSHYYTKEDTDTGIMMETMVPSKDIKDGINEFLEDGHLRVRIIWVLNQQLFQSTFHQYDEVYRYQREQMMKDLETLVFTSSNNVFDGNSQENPSNAQAESNSQNRVAARGRRISSLGDEIYYMTDRVKKETTLLQQQHSLESFQLREKRAEKIQNKQASMPGWTGITPPVKLKQSNSQEQAKKPRAGSMLRLSGSLSRLSFSNLRLSAPKLNTIQTAVLNPETFVQHQSGETPFIPGTSGVSCRRLSRSQDTGLSDSNSTFEKNQMLPSKQVTNSADNLEKGDTWSSRRPRPNRLLGINKCQSFN